MSDVRVVLVDLRNRDEIRDVRLGNRRERIKRLRHHALVCRDDEDSDVCRRRAAGAQRFEGFVSGRIQEGDAAAVMLGDVCGDVLSDAARFARDDIRLPDVIQKRRLPMIYVAHHRDDGRSWYPRHKNSISSQK